MQHLGAVSGEHLVNVVTVRDAGVEVPAQIVEVGLAQHVRDQRAGLLPRRERCEHARAQRAVAALDLVPDAARDRGQLLFRQEEEADDDVGHLDTGVVDVVLHLGAVTEPAQAAHQHVPQHGVAQMTDVCGLVGVDVGVLDDDLAGLGRGGGGRGQRVSEESSAPEAKVAKPGTLDPGLGRQHRQRAFRRRCLYGGCDAGGDLLGDRSRRAFERLG